MHSWKIPPAIIDPYRLECQTFRGSIRLTAQLAAPNIAESGPQENVRSQTAPTVKRRMYETRVGPARDPVDWQRDSLCAPRPGGHLRYEKTDRVEGHCEPVAVAQSAYRYLSRCEG